MTLISAGTIRRLARPLLLHLWLRPGTRRASTFDIGWTRLRIRPTVFHPKYFGSSLIFARFIESRELRGKRFLDMGTGSGIIGLFAARAGAEVTSVDINPEAVSCAAENSATAGLPVRCIHSDLFEALPAERFDVIAWNPPFFAKAPVDLAEAAMYAGLEHSAIRRFAADLRDHLLPGGRIYVIFSLDVLAALESILRAAGFEVAVAARERWGLAETMVILEIR